MVAPVNNNTADQVIAELNSRFVSGNAIDVERTHITASEWNSLQLHIDDLKRDARRYRLLRIVENLSHSQPPMRAITFSICNKWASKPERLDSFIDGLQLGDLHG